MRFFRHILLGLPEDRAKDIIIQIFEGLKIMHRENFVHRDLKLDVRISVE
jgi:serine/threonine protein kinase